MVWKHDSCLSCSLFNLLSLLESPSLFTLQMCRRPDPRTQRALGVFTREIKQTHGAEFAAFQQEKSQEERENDEILNTKCLTIMSSLFHSFILFLFKILNYRPTSENGYF